MTGNIEILNEQALSMSEMKEELKKIKSRDKELTFRANKVEEYLNTFDTVDFKKVEELKKKLEGLNVLRLKDRHIVKILDVMPEDLDSLRLIFSGENLTLKQEDLDKILKALK